MFAFVWIALTKRGLATRRIKASQMLQSNVCAFRSIADFNSNKPVDRGGSVGSDEPPRLPNDPLEVFKNYYTGYF